jgi:hypothetical protein
MEATLHKKKRREMKQQNKPLKKQSGPHKKKGRGGEWKREERASP